MIQLCRFKDDPTYIDIVKILQGLHFYINLLIEEDLLFYFRLSLVEIKLTLPLDIHPRLDFIL